MDKTQEQAKLCLPLSSGGVAGDAAITNSRGDVVALITDADYGLFIVRACNCHAVLLNACKLLVAVADGRKAPYPRHSLPIRLASAAIAKATKRL